VPKDTKSKVIYRSSRVAPPRHAQIHGICPRHGTSCGTAQRRHSSVQSMQMGIITMWGWLATIPTTVLYKSIVERPLGPPKQSHIRLLRSYGRRALLHVASVDASLLNITQKHYQTLKWYCMRLSRFYHSLCATDSRCRLRSDRSDYQARIRQEGASACESIPYAIIRVDCPESNARWLKRANAYTIRDRVSLCAHVHVCDTDGMGILCSGPK
jgi:hypothetical protein